MVRAILRAGLLLVAIFTALLWVGSLRGRAAGNGVDPLPHPALNPGRASVHGQDSVVFAGGCFWGVQAVFEHVTGVTAATAGYAGGAGNSATYEQVSTGSTGHAESVRVVFDPASVSFGELLEVFFSVAHDPTERNRQGPDTGSQYRSAIFFTSEEQERVARAYIEQLNAAGIFKRPIVTEVAALRGFYPAEPYHQHYAERHPYDPYIAINDLPKVTHLRKAYPGLYH